MGNETDVIGTLLDKMEAYGETSIELIKLKAAEATVQSIATLSIRLVLLTVLFIVLFMINIALALWIGEYYDHFSIGFFVMTGVNVVILLSVYLLRNNNRIENVLSNMIFKKVFPGKKS